MDRVEWLAFVVVTVSLIGISVISNQTNQSNLDRLYYGMNHSITSLYNTTITNLTNLTLSFQNTLTQKDSSITSLQSQVNTLIIERDALQSQYNLLNTNISHQVDLKVYEIRQRLINVSEQLNETLAKLKLDPTTDQLITFLSEDLTDDHIYSDVEGPGYYVCTNFTRDLIHNASSHGWRALAVSMNLWNETYGDAGHMIVAFNTTDNGLTFVEPQSDVLYYNMDYFSLSYNETIVANYTVTHYYIYW